MNDKNLPVLNLSSTAGNRKRVLSTRVEYADGLLVDAAVQHDPNAGSVSDFVRLAVFERVRAVLKLAA